jgi:hypothetical protein
VVADNETRHVSHVPGAEPAPKVEGVKLKKKKVLGGLKLKKIIKFGAKF